MVEMICSQPDAEVAFNLASALGYASAFGREKVCRVLLRRGADPTVTGKDGLRPIDRVKAAKPLGGREVIELLEGYMSKKEESAYVPAQGSSSQLLPIYQNEESSSTEKQLFILATEIFPGLVDVFAQTQLESVKYQAVLILLQLVSRLSSQSLTIINTYPFGISLGFRLTQMIFMALAEESERTVHCVFQLCHQLLTKARSIYLPLMHRTGIIPLIKSIDSVMQLPHFRFLCENDYGNYYYPIREISNETDGQGSDDSSDSTVDFIPNENVGESDGTDSEYTEAADVATEGSHEGAEGEQQNEP
ncbi:unnamed protein product, partial [Hydatigera taeniaeformis]|uniref:ANK_REP_REGION domain-containing protein n=1 Tax=Hydatigena taeniaeformis TaxID=6205 RepID=A0A0R3WYJ3_HYDTA